MAGPTSPPAAIPRGGETAAARYCADVLGGAGIEAEVIEVTTAGRGSVRRSDCRATGPATEPPLILLSHIDVVPVDAESWTRDPFGGDLIDGVVWGRGAVDMKDMVAMELGVMLALRRSGVELRRDVIFAALADEEAGGAHGARGLVDAPAGALRRCDRAAGRRRHQRGRRLLDDRRRTPLLHHPGGREGHRLDPAVAPPAPRATDRCRIPTTRRSSSPRRSTALAADAGRRVRRVVPARRRRSSSRWASTTVARLAESRSGRRIGRARTPRSPIRSCAARSTRCCATP